MAGYVPDVDAFSMLSGIGNTLQNNQDRKDAGPLSIDLARAAAGLPPLAQQPQQPGVFGQIINGAKNIFAPQPQAQAPTPSVNQRPISTSTNIPSDYLQKTAQIESGGDPNATNPSGASGLYQFTPGTAKKYGLLNADGSVNNDPQAQTVAATKLAQDNATSLSQTLGRAPTGAELYLAHQQGAGGASALLANPSQGAVDALTPVYGSAQKAAAAITTNGGNPNMTAGQFASLWTNKYNNAGGGQGAPMAFAGAQPPTSPAPGLSPSTPLPGTGYTAVQGYAGNPAPNANPNASQQPSASPALPMAPQGVPSVGSTQTPMGQQIPPLSTEALSRALTNPYTKDLAQGLLTKYAQPNTIQTIGNTVYSVNARTSTLTPIMQVPKEPSVQELPVTGPDGTMIGSQKYWVSPDKAPVPLGGVDTSKMKSQSTDLITPEDRTAHGIDPSFKGPVQVDENGKLSFPGKPTTEMTLNQNNTSKLDGKIIDVLDDGRTKAEAAVNTIAAIKRQKDALNGGMITGVGADLITSGKQALAQVLGLDPSTVTNSQVFDAAAKQKGAELAKALSNSGHTTNADLAVGNIIAGGDRTKTEDALRTIIAAQEQLQRDTITRHNNNVDKFVKINPGQTDQANFFKVDLPTETGSATDKPGTQSAAQPQARQPLPQGYSAASAVAEGRAAIAAGKDPAAVAARLQSYGIDPKNLSAQ